MDYIRELMQILMRTFKIEKLALKYINQQLIVENIELVIWRADWLRAGFGMASPM